jgi:hypothetical protein
MQQRFATTHHAINLLRNGNFDLIQETDGESVPAFWYVDGAVADGVTNSETVTSYSVIQGAEIVAGGSDNYMRVVMQDASPVRLGQSFVREEALSFPTPLQPGVRRALGSGYLNDTTQLLPSYNYTIALSTLVRQGTVDYSVVAFDVNDIEFELTLLESQNNSVSKQNEYVRTTLSFFAPQPIYRLEVRLTRAPGAGLTELDLALLSMSQGTYTRLPYLPDPFISCFPAGAIVMTQGDSCPAGFAELGNGDLAALPDWLDAASDAQGRKGHFPRSADTQTGTEFHTATPDFKPFLADTIDFPKETNLDYVEAAGGNSDPYNNPQGDLPGSPSGTPTHEHELTESGTRPVSWAFRLCKRL